jgi:hypothetical protein
MSARTCSHCGQAIPETRFGVRLSPLKARIVDTISRCGPDGIDADTLFWLIFYERKVTSRLTLKSHVNQINDLLAHTDYRINGIRGGGRRFTLVSRKIQEAA